MSDGDNEIAVFKDKIEPADIQELQLGIIYV